MAIKRKNSKGEWVIDQEAIETSIVDLEGNFESDNVEGALRELANKAKEGQDLSALEAKIESNRQGVVDNSQRLADAEKDIEWLKVNGGGGGGTAVPTITSTFENTTIEKGQDVEIPIFFSSPNMGNGTAYILVNNIEVETFGLTQGNNVIILKNSHLTNKGENRIGIYAKDRAGIVSNQLSWVIVSGGIELISTFDYTIDYGVTDTIRIPYALDSGITSEEPILYLTIDGITTEYPSRIGNNFIDIKASKIGLGTHAVSMYAKIDKYTSKTINFNIVVVSTYELYLSTNFVDEQNIDYGVPIQIDYRLSKKSTESFYVNLIIDGKIVKKQTLPIGSYYWTIPSLEIGAHLIEIQVISMDYTEEKFLTIRLNIVQGDYTPVTDYKLGLLCDLNAVGKSNNDVDANIWKDESGNGHDAQLINFNFGTNGFIDDTLVCDNDAYVVIPWSPWRDNAVNGSTIDIIYEPINTGVENCRVLDYTEVMNDFSTDEIKPFKGVFADVLMATTSSASSGATASKINLDDESGEIHLTWVLDRANKFMKTYINGVLSRIMFLTDSGVGVNKFYEDFAIDKYIYLNSTKGENCGTNNIKRFRVYDHALTSDDVLRNHLANIRDLKQQEKEYKFNYENVTLPKMYLNGDTKNMTAYQSVPMRVEYVSTNEEKYGRSFNTGVQNNQVLIQGTSSLQYVRHNYTIYLKDEYGANMMYNPYGDGSVEDYVFCLKADYIESSHANNTGIAKFVNDCLYDTKTPSQLENNNCRTTINGFPIELYINGEYMGVYNFNHDRYSYESYGYDYTKNPNMLVYEINSNSNTSAGAFFRYGANAESSANVTELEYYKRDFNLIYGNRTAESDSYSEIKQLVEWVSVAEQDLFRETLDEHFNREYLFRYYLMVLFIGAVDSLGKNLKINTWDGKIWYPTFYDLDTVLGIDNSGYLTIPPDVEIEEGSYNTSNSNLWTKVWTYFNSEIKEEWAKMRRGKFTLDNLMEYVYGEQISRIPTKLYNDDAQVKYLDFGSLYTYCCHGSKEHQIKRWLRERIAYVDSMMGYFTSQDDQVTIRMNKTGYIEFEITPYVPLYLSVKWSNATGGTQTFRVGRGQSQKFYYNSTSATDQEIIIPYASQIKRLDNLSNLNPSSCILSNAKKLTEIEIHSSELYNINVTNNKYLRSVNLENCVALGTVTATQSSLDLSKCKYLRYCNVKNTALTDVQLNSSGGSLREIYYPITIQSVQLIKQRLLEVVGLPTDLCTSLYTVNIEDCPNIKRLNTSSNEEEAKSFTSMAYCRDLTLKNSLNLSSLNLDVFYNLIKLKIENIDSLESVNFNDLLEIGKTPTIKYIGLVGCPLLEEINFNCTSEEYDLAFENNAVINFGGLFNLKTITANRPLKGVKTMVLPMGLKTLDLRDSYGDKYSDLENIWAYNVCDVNSDSVTPTAIHVDGGFKGIDFDGMNVENINLETLVNIINAKNFRISPTNIKPNFNKNRDNDEYAYFKPSGSIDLTYYKGDFVGFFKGINLNNFEVICDNVIRTTDFSYCYYEAEIKDIEEVADLLSKALTITNLDYCFYKTALSDVSNIFNKILIGNNTTMNYTFAECHNLTNINGIIIPSKVIEANGIFGNCPITNINNVEINVKGSVKNMFDGCYRLSTITNLKMPNATDMSELFKNCTNLSSIEGFTIPNTCTSLNGAFYECFRLTEKPIANIPNSVTDISYMYYGCQSLTDISNTTFGSGIKKYQDFLTNSNVEYINNLTVNTIYLKFTGNQTIRECKNYKPSSNTTDFIDCFRGCSNLTDFTLHNDATFKYGLLFTSMFMDCTSLKYDIVLPIQAYDVTDMYKNCSAMTHVHSNWYNEYVFEITSTDCYKNCIGVEYVDDEYVRMYETDIGTMYIPQKWGGLGLTKDTTTILKINTSLGDNSLTVKLRRDNMSEREGVQPTVIDWGDGTITERVIPTYADSITHTYEAHSEYIVRFNTSIILNSAEYGANTHGNVKQKITEIISIGRKRLTYGGLEDVSENLSATFNGFINLKYINLSNLDKKIIYNASNLFKGINNSTTLTIESDTPIKISNANGMFRDSTKLISINNLNTSFDFFNCSNIEDMFNGCKNITTIDVSGCDFSNVTTMSWFALDCYKLTEIIGLSDIYMPKLRTLLRAFYDCKSLTSIDLHNVRNEEAINWCSRQEYNGISGINSPFYGCTSLTYLNMSNMKFEGYAIGHFTSATQLKEIYLDNCDFSQLDKFAYIFRDASALEKVSLLNVTFPSEMSLETCFYSCYKLADITLTVANTTKPCVTSLYGTFHGCNAITEINFLQQFDYSKLTSMNSTFRQCKLLSKIEGLEYMHTPQLTNMEFAFCNCQSLTKLDLSNFKPNNAVLLETVRGNSGDGVDRVFGRCDSVEYLDLSNFKIMGNFFATCYVMDNLKTLKMNNVTFSSIYNNNLSNIASPNLETFEMMNADASEIIDASYMLYGSKLTTIKLDGTDFSNVINANYMFAHNKELVTVNLKVLDGKFNSVQTMVSMFEGCSNLTSINGLSEMSFPNLISIVNIIKNCPKIEIFDMSNAKPTNPIAVEGYGSANVHSSKSFYGCSSLTVVRLPYFKFSQNMAGFLTPTPVTTVDLSNCSIKNTTNGGLYLFYNCKSLTNLDLTDFDTYGVTTFSQMFWDCNNLQNIDVSSFDTSKVNTMMGMFAGCNQLTTIDISNFDLSTVTSLSAMFANCKSLETIVGLNQLHAPKLKDMSRMIESCQKLQTFDVSNFKNETDSLYMENANGAWNNYSSFFYGCTSLRKINLSNLNLSLQMICTFNGNNTDNQLGSLEELYMENCTYTNSSAHRMFEACKARTISLKNTTFPNLLYMDSMFIGCSKVEELDVSGITTDNVLSASSMFKNCDNLKRVEFGDNFYMKNTPTLSCMFQNCSNLLDFDASKIKINHSVVKDLTYMFAECDSLVNMDFSSFGGDSSSAVKSLHSFVTNCDNLRVMNISGWNFPTDINDQYMIRGVVFDKIIAYNTRTDLLYRISLFAGAAGSNDIRFLLCDEYNSSIPQDKFVQIPLNENYVRATRVMLREPILELFNELRTVNEGTVSIGSDNISRLTADDLLIATSKGWTVI